MGGAAGAMGSGLSTVGGGIKNFFTPSNVGSAGNYGNYLSTDLPAQGPSPFTKFMTKYGSPIAQGMQAGGIQNLLNPGQRQQQGGQPVNFNMPAQPYIPPPQAINPFGMPNFSNAITNYGAPNPALASSNFYGM